MVSSLAGFRRIRPGVYERTTNDPRQRKALLRQLPRKSLVAISVLGDAMERYGERQRVKVWRIMNFARQDRTRPMPPEELLSMWSRRAGPAGRVVLHPKRWLVRVYVPE